MPISINGWPVLDSPPWDDPKLTRLKVPGTPAVAYLRASVAPLFVSIALDYHQTIHPLTGRLDVDGYDYRQARMASRWSDHSSGTAMDVRASAEGAQGPGMYSWWDGPKAAAARAILARYEIVMWGGPVSLGGSYNQPQNWDFMHWALKPGTTQADVNRVIARLGIRPDGTRPSAPKPPAPADGVVSLSGAIRGLWKDVRVIQIALNRVLGTRLVIDGKWGPATQAAFDRFRRERMGLTGEAATGPVGANSLQALATAAGITLVP